MRFTIGNKLIISFFSTAILFVSISGIFHYYIKQVNQSYADLINRRVKILTNAKNIEVLAFQQTNSLRGYLLTQNRDLLIELDVSSENMNQLINETQSLVTQPENIEVVQKLEVLNRKFEKSYEELLVIFHRNYDQKEAIDFFKTEVFPVGTELLSLTKFLSDRQQQLLDEGRTKNTHLVENINLATILLSIFSFILTIFIGWVISKRITSNLYKITGVIAGVTSDVHAVTILPQIEVRSRDEIGDIAIAFNEMAKALRGRSWLETNIAEMVTMYQGIHDLQTLAQQFITKITPMVEASYGVFYIKKGSGDQRRLQKLAIYAYNRDDIDSPDFNFGEGLVGQAAVENQTILLTDIPEQYSPISTGTGMVVPKSIIIVPVEFEGQVIAVIELASIKTFSTIQQTLLKQVLNHVGITINSVAGRMQVENLLKEAKALTEELQSQSEELQLQQEELKSINDKLEEQYKNSEQKTRELEKTKSELEEKAGQLSLSSKYKTEFLANMSHELRTPLNSLLILARLLEENENGNLTEKQVEFAHTIYTSGNDLLQLINDILDLSKIESGKIDIISDTVNVKHLCAMMEQQFLPIARQKNLEFTIQLDDDLPKTFCVDEQRLQQILKNLLSNAFKFTAKGKNALHVYLAEHNKLNPAIAFSINDTGIGIPKERHRLIFKAFQQADGTTSRKYGGTGLGLSISRELALLLGGEIDVESVPGEGSTFTLYLPIEESVAQANPLFFHEETAATLDNDPDMGPEVMERQGGDLRLRGKKVLIIDDDMRNIFAITTALENKGMIVVFAENGIQGIRILQDHPDIDLILMDIMMPEMDGYEAMRSIRQMPEYEGLPIIALTAKAMKNDREKCLEAGASDYISKPINLDQLFSLMQVWMYR